VYNCNVFHKKDQMAKDSTSKDPTKEEKDNAITKISWSLPLVGLFAACSVYKTVSLFKVANEFRGI
jgi:hypothetical protein